MPRSTADFRAEWDKITKRSVSSVSQEGYSLPDAPSYKVPKLPTNLSDVSYHCLID